MTCQAATVIVPYSGDGRLLSGFGVRRGRTTGQPTFHAGIDIGGGRGTRVYAPRGGIVERVASNEDRRGGFRGYGNAIVIRHEDDGVWSFYAHLDLTYVAEGELIVAGQPIGIMGNTTNGKFPGMGRHLHMEVRGPKPDGSSPFPGRYGAFNVDPYEWLTDLGIGFGPDGQSYDLEQQACGSPQAPVRTLETMSRLYPSAYRSRPSLFTRPLGGLGSLTDVDPNADYEPPIPDASYFRGAPLWMHVAGAVGLATVGGVGWFLSTKT